MKTNSIHIGSDTKIVASRIGDTDEWNVSYPNALLPNTREKLTTKELVKRLEENIGTLNFDIKRNQEEIDRLLMIETE